MIWLALASILGQQNAQPGLWTYQSSGIAYEADGYTYEGVE